MLNSKPASHADSSVMSNSGERARKLARSLARRANALALALYVLGVASCGLLAHLARDVYVDENAFLLGSTSATLDDEDARRAQNDANELMRAVDVAEDRSTTTRKRLEWINRTLDDAGFESYRSPTRDGRHNAHTVARATRGNGQESMALVTVLGSGDVEAEAVTIGLALTAFNKIGRAPWLAKDLIWVCVDGEGGNEIDGTMDWLKIYYSTGDGRAAGGFERAGVIQQAFVFSAPGDETVSAARVKLEGWNGVYPNQDIFTMFRSVVQSPTINLRVTLEQETAGRAQEDSDASIQSLTESGVRFMWRAATGVPSGAHAAFKTHSIDAMSIDMMKHRDHERPIVGSHAYLVMGQMLELTFRACNNLLELLHHSCFYYVMLGPHKFLGIAEYIAPQAILLVSLLMTAGKLTTCGANDEFSEETDGETRASHDWFLVISRLLLAITCGALVGKSSISLHMLGLSHVAVTVTTMGISAIAIVVFLRLTRNADAPAVRRVNETSGIKIVPQEHWVGVKIVNIAWVLFTMSGCMFFNFALALLVTLALAPMCLLCSPSENGSKRNASAAIICTMPVVWMLILSRFVGSNVLESLGLLAAHHVRWQTFSLPVAFSIAFPVVLLSLHVNFAQASKNKND